MNNKRLVNRLISSVCSIPLHSINSGVLTEEDWKIIERRTISLQHAPLLLDDTPSMTLNDLRESCHRTMEKFHMKGVFIDSLQHIKTEYKANRTRNDDISELMYGIKALAYELDIPIFVISSMNRYADRRDSLEGKRPQLSDLRESGAIEDVADLVMFVHRPEMFHIYQDDCGRDLHGAAQIIIAKNRMGRTGDVLLSFKGDYVRFENPKPF
jgi:replicative DNA helicase